MNIGNWSTGPCTTKGLEQVHENVVLRECTLFNEFLKSSSHSICSKTDYFQKRSSQSLARIPFQVLPNSDPDCSRGQVIEGP